MPQMAPLNWLNLFIFFLMIFLMFSSMNFFQFNYSIKISKKKEDKIKSNWKW